MSSPEGERERERERERGGRRDGCESDKMQTGDASIARRTPRSNAAAAAAAAAAPRRGVVIPGLIAGD